MVEKIENTQGFDVERKIPQGLNKQQQACWVDAVIALQVEGVSEGIRPQNLIIPNEFMSKWRTNVWSYYRRTLSNKDKKATVQYPTGRELHTLPQSGGKPPTPLRYRF